MVSAWKYRVLSIRWEFPEISTDEWNSFLRTFQKRGRERARYIELVGNFLPRIYFSFDHPSRNFGTFLLNDSPFGNSNIFGFPGNFLTICSRFEIFGWIGKRPSIKRRTKYHNRFASRILNWSIQPVTSTLQVKIYYMFLTELNCVQSNLSMYRGHPRAHSLNWSSSRSSFFWEVEDSVKCKEWRFDFNRFVVTFILGCFLNWSA